MDGCRALEQGQPLKVGHLAQGFRRNAAHLVTIGGISLVGNLVVMMIILALGGEAMTAMAKTLAKSSTITPQITGADAGGDGNRRAGRCWSAPPCPCRS